jgi:hypothetical protein
LSGHIPGKGIVHRILISALHFCMTLAIENSGSAAASLFHNHAFSVAAIIAQRTDI